MLLSRVSINNPHYKLPKMYLYELIRKMYDEFVKDIGFKCNRCVNSCCYFTEEEAKLQEIGIYEEDEIFLEDGGYKDFNGYTLCSRPLCEGFKQQFELIEDVSMEELKEIEIHSLSVVKHTKMLNIIEENGDYRCYYYNTKEKKCNIHSNKPLVCYTYPIRIFNTLDYVGLQICNDCKFIIDLSEEIGASSLNDYFANYLSYIKYSFVVLLYMIKKDRILIKDNMIFPKNKRKDIFKSKAIINKIINPKRSGNYVK